MSDDAIQEIASLEADTLDTLTLFTEEHAMPNPSPLEERRAEIEDSKVYITREEYPPRAPPVWWTISPSAQRLVDWLWMARWVSWHMHKSNEEDRCKLSLRTPFLAVRDHRAMLDVEVGEGGDVGMCMRGEGAAEAVVAAWASASLEHEDVPDELHPPSEHHRLHTALIPKRLWPSMMQESYDAFVEAVEEWVDGVGGITDEWEEEMCAAVAEQLAQRVVAPYVQEQFADMEDEELADMYESETSTIRQWLNKDNVLRHSRVLSLVPRQLPTYERYLGEVGEVWTTMVWCGDAWAAVQHTAREWMRHLHAWTNDSLCESLTVALALPVDGSEVEEAHMLWVNVEPTTKKRCIVSVVGREGEELDNIVLLHAWGKLGEDVWQGPPFPIMPTYERDCAVQEVLQETLREESSVHWSDVLNPFSPAIEARVDPMRFFPTREEGNER
jgi:hypothetical protein